MASIGTITGSKLIGCPIIVPVTAGNIAAGATFHRVRLAAEVEGEISGEPISGDTFEFSTPANNGEKVYFDVSSALRAVADKYEFIPGLLSYPSFAMTLTAYDDYLLNGEERHNGSDGRLPDGPYYIGRLTDRERLTGARPSIYSRKPTTSPEVCFVGSQHLHAGPFGNAPAVNNHVVAAGMATINGTYKIFGIPKPVDGYELLFINSLGVHENVFIRCLPQTEVNITTDRYVISRQETLTSFSRAVMRKQNDYEQWRMSSGPLDRAWQQWWLHEPLMAKWAWLDVDNKWLPVHIIPEETTTGADRASGKLLEVQFTIRFDINGSPFA